MPGRKKVNGLTIGERFQQWDRQAPIPELMVERDHGYETLCWDAEFDLNNPYPRISVTYGRQSVGEFILGLIKGRPRWVVESHLCDNKRCCRPSHLEIDTMSGNMQARYDRGLDSTIRTGEHNPNSTLTQIQVDNVRSQMVWSESDQRYHPVYYRQFGDLSNEFGVSRTTIRNIATGAHWPWN